jgi:hypothetical protein
MAALVAAIHAFLSCDTSKNKAWMPGMRRA